MKKNIFKKIVASLATVAMAAGLFTAMPAEEAKAADSKELVVYLTDSSNVKKVLLDIHDWGGGASLTPAGAVTTESAVSGWGRNLYEFTQDSTNPAKWTIEVEGVIDLEAGDWSDMQIVAVLNDNNVWGGQYKMANNDEDNKKANANQWNANDVLYYTIDVSTDSWQKITASETDPTAITAAEVMALIDAIGTVELTEESLAKITAAEAGVAAYQGNVADITNYDKLTAAKAKYDELVAAKDAAAAGKLTVYVKNDAWTQMKVYGWGGADFGEWSGTALTALEKNTGWYSITTDITKAVCLIFNDGAGSQTVNWENVPAGTYWLVLTEKNGEGKYLVDNVATTAPAGWKDEAAEEIENPDADTTPGTGSTGSTGSTGTTGTTGTTGSTGTTTDKTPSTGTTTDKAPATDKTPTTDKKPATDKTDDKTSTTDKTDDKKPAADKTEDKVEEQKGVTVEVVLSADAKWDKVFLYAWGGDVKLEWPGIEMTAKDGKWYATLDTTATKLSYVISNGNGEQTVDIADVEGKNVTIKLGAKDGDKFTATGAASTSTSTGATGTQKPGDVAPIAIMLVVAAVASVMVVASKKKAICE